jgi:hypothetical protein
MESRGKIFESTLLCLDKSDLTVRLGLKWRSDSETEQKAMKKLRKNEQLGHNFSYPSSAAAVVFGGHLSAQAAFRLDRKSPAIRPCV